MLWLEEWSHWKLHLVGAGALQEYGGVTGESSNRTLLSISRYPGPRKRRSLVCSKALGSGLQWLRVGVGTPCVLLASTASMWFSVMAGNDAKWLFSWMLLWQSEVALFLTIAGAEVLDASNSFELSLTSEAYQDAVSQEFEEYWLPHKNETCELYVIKQYNNQAKMQQNLWLSGAWRAKLLDFWGAESLGRE